MKKRTLLLGFAALTISAASFAGTPNNMQVWLKNGEQKAFDINEVDSVTFGVTPQITYESLTENTMPPTFSKPNPLMVSAQEQAFIQANNKFATDCFEKIRKMPKEPGSTTPRPIHFFSPVSLNIALGFCANGASDKGAKEIYNALGFSSTEEMNDFYQKLYQSINSNVDSVDIHTANALWLQEGIPVFEKYLKTAQQKYYATVRHLNFKEDSNGSKDTIDHWAALMTNDRIKSLGIELTENTRLIINNACYFKANWKIKFANQGKWNFNGAYDKTGSTDFMGIEYAYMKCAQTDKFQAIKLDYSENGQEGKSDTTSTSTYSMIVVLPQEGYTLDDVLPTLQWESIPFKYQTCELFMPKFESEGNYQLTDSLKKLNIKDIFMEYPNAINETEIDGSVRITQVTQDYFLKVDEKGTEAAVVTSIGGNAESALPGTEFSMICNRPFAFAIRENNTGLLIFMGEYDFVP
ncbi:MAG: hypothetical protein J6T28_05850 [Paludibacteraceae bacterium]|nr:hypothetical protein [Paludibacteraceae bacterium]